MIRLVLIRCVRFNLLLITALGLSSCSANKGKDDTYVDWRCSGNKRSDNWSCQPLEIKNGQPVNSGQLVNNSQLVNDSGEKTSVVSATAKAATPAKADATETPKAVYVQVPRHQWRTQLPTLTAEPVIPDNIEGVGHLRKPRSLPVRQPAPVSLDSGERLRPKRNDPAHVVETAQEEKNNDAVQLLAPEPGFTVQLGAFKTENQLQQFIRDNRLETLQFNHVTTHKDDAVWHLVTWGHFGTPAEARQAWSQREERYPKVESWVRPLGSLQKNGSPRES